MLPHTSPATSLLRSGLLAVIALVFSACAGGGAVLNSERIEETFGSYGVDVLQAGERIRVSSLYSEDAGGKVTRTLAVVEFAGRVSRNLASEHEAVLAGGSLGAVFKSAGWQIDKINQYVGDLEVGPRQAPVFELMQIEPVETLAAHVYLFVVSRDEQSYTYATIVELHHPDYLSAAELEIIYVIFILVDLGQPAHAVSRVRRAAAPRPGGTNESNPVGGTPCSHRVCCRAGSISCRPAPGSPPARSTGRARVLRTTPR